MTKITRQRLPRGTKLSAQHWNEPTAAISTAMGGSDLGPENLELNNANFSMSLNIPRLPAWAFWDQEASADVSELVIPFVLPPLQDQWTDAQIGDSTPMPILRSMSVSLDLGMGNNAAQDSWDQVAGVVDTSFDSDAASVYDMEIEIRAKDQSYVYGHTSDVIFNVAKETIFDTQISGLLFSGEAQQFNPIFVDGIDETMDPYKTYILYVNFPNIWDGYTDNSVLYKAAISSLTVKLNFEGPILQRDQYDPNDYPIQNVPVNWDGGNVGQTISLDTAVKDNLVTARAGTAAMGRIQRNAEIIDNALGHGLPTGRDIRGVQPPGEAISHSAGYTVLALPMFGGWYDIRSDDINQVGLPYGAMTLASDATPWAGELQDRRIIPISAPFTIHRVVAVHSFYSWPVGGLGEVLNYPNWQSVPRDSGTWGSATVPVSPTFTSTIGVGIVSGLRADAKEYEQVAYSSMTPATKQTSLIDRVKSGKYAPYWGLGTAPTEDYDFELFEVPLVQNSAGGAETRGYYDQGYPYYTGKSGLATQSRHIVGVAGGGTRTPNTAGGEQFIEVRWSMADAAGLNYGATGNPNPSGTSFVGMGGCWIYIYGKTEATTTGI